MKNVHCQKPLMGATSHYFIYGTFVKASMTLNVKKVMKLLLGYKYFCVNVLEIKYR